MVALLIVGYLVWLPSSLQWIENGLPLTYAAIGVLASLAALLLWRYQAEMRTWLQQNWRLVLLGETVFGLSLLAFVGIRILNPDLWQPWNGGEKLMDIAYLNSVLRSAYFPPPDPYYAQGYLNYYYYGQFLLSILIRLTGIKPTIGFNLAVPLLFAFTVKYCVLDRLHAGRWQDTAGRQGAEQARGGRRRQSNGQHSAASILYRMASGTACWPCCASLSWATWPARHRSWKACSG